MTCREARDLADPFLSDQLLVETTHEIVAHLETCPACRGELGRRRRLRSQLQSAIAGASALAPRGEFIEGLSARLRGAATPAAASRPITRRAWLESWWAAAAALVALAGGGIFARDTARRSRLSALAANAAGDHQNCAITFNLAERPIALEEAARRYDRSLASLETLVLPAGLRGAAVLDRHSCVFGGLRFGHVVFRYEEQVASLLVTNGVELPGEVPSLIGSDTTLRVAAFSAGRHAVFVVSALSGADTLRMAQALAPPVARALSAT